MKNKWDINKIEAKATSFGTGSHIITPATWSRKTVIAMLKTKWDAMQAGAEEEKEI